MDRKMLRALALAGAVTGVGLVASAGGAAAEPQTRWACRDDLPPGRTFDLERCSYRQYPLRAPATVPNVGPRPGPGPSPGPTPYSS